MIKGSRNVFPTVLAAEPLLQSIARLVQGRQVTAHHQLLPLSLLASGPKGRNIGEHLSVQRQ
jgi:hypothetical protein